MARRRCSGITNLGFNQDQGCFICCRSSGLRVYNVEPLFEKSHYSKDELGEVSLCEMVFRSNWLLVVRARRPCSLLLLDDGKRSFRAEVAFKTPIQALRARRDKVAVVLASSIQVLTLPSLQRVALLRTSAAARPLCAIATESNVAHILAAPAHRRGSMQIVDVSHAVRGSHSYSPAVVACHQSELACLSLTPNGAKVATASERGTLIRVWDTCTKLLLHELRRGSDHADIYCINFNPAGSLVCCVSDKGTLHVWNARGSYEHLAATHAAEDTRALCAFAGNNHAVVICEDGSFHKFTVSPEGSCYRNNFDYFLQVGDDDEFIQ